MTISEAVVAAIEAHARKTAPEECCGVLMGKDDRIVEAVPTTNTADTPRTRYLIDPADYFAVMRRAREQALEVVGAYHSHPRSAPVPSPTDRAEGFGNFLFLIVGLSSDPPELTGWRWHRGNFEPVPLVRTP